jgi:hypothetical protein
LPYGQKIAKIVFDIVKRSTIVYYHYEPGSIIRQVKEYSKDKLPPPNKLQNGMSRDESTEIYYQELQKITDMEKKCTSDIKSHQANIK